MNTKEEDMMKVWTFALKRTEDDWVKSPEPIPIDMPTTMLDTIKELNDHGNEKNKTNYHFYRMDYVRTKRTVFFFETEREAWCFAEGFEYGTQIELYGEQIWQSMLDGYIDIRTSIEDDQDVEDD